MIKSLEINNFKAIKHLNITFTPFTVLIGGNSCGKSTVLQALDFTRTFATRDIDEYLNERGWTIEDVKSQFSNDDDVILFNITMLLDVNSKKANISWCFGVTPVSNVLSSFELIKNVDTGEILLSRGMTEPDKPEGASKLRLRSSYLKLIDENSPSTELSVELLAVKKFFTQSSSYELLTPDRMREKGSRGEVKDIGMGGEKLAAYINRMSATRKSKLNKMFSDFIGYTVKTTTETKRPGWVDLFINESFSNTKTKIKATHMSDGLLRLLALIAASIPEEKNTQEMFPDIFYNIPDSGFILLDEIEDGVNPYLVEKIISMLRMVISDYNMQVIITTHSPVIVNHFEKHEIVFMWRDATGQIHAKPMFESDEMLDTLDCFNPGEVWLNYSKEEILDLMNPSQLEEQQ